MAKRVTVSILVPPEAEPSVVVGTYRSLLVRRRAVEPHHERKGGATLQARARWPHPRSHHPATGVRLLPDRTFADGPPGDLVLVPTLLVGSGGEFGRRHRVIVDWVRRAHDLGRPVFSICTGALLLAEAGLLEFLRRDYALGVRRSAEERVSARPGARLAGVGRRQAGCQRRHLRGRGLVDGHGALSRRPVRHPRGRHAARQGADAGLASQRPDAVCPADDAAADGGRHDPAARNGSLTTMLIRTRSAS